MSNERDITLSDAIDFFKAAGMHVAVVGFDSPPLQNCDVAISRPEWKVFLRGEYAILDMDFDSKSESQQIEMPIDYAGILRRIAWKHNHSLKRGKA